MISLNDWLKERISEDFVPTKLTWWAQVLSDVGGFKTATTSEVFAFIDQGIIEDTERP